MGNKIQVIFTAECKEEETYSVLGLGFIPTTVSVRIEASGLEEGNHSPEQLFGKILMKEAPVIARVIHERVCNVIRKKGTIIIDEKLTETTINKTQTH